MTWVETKKLLLPCLGLCLGAYCISALLGYTGLNVVLGLVLGTSYGLINFYMIGRAAEAAVRRTPTRAQAYMTTQYFVRLLLTGELIYIAIKLPQIHVLAFVIPLFFPKAGLVLNAIFQKKGG